jgi:hypothetical protein
MPAYRCYLMNAAEAIISVDTVVAGDDAGVLMGTGRRLSPRKTPPVARRGLGARSIAGGYAAVLPPIRLDASLSSASSSLPG